MKYIILIISVSASFLMGWTINGNRTSAAIKALSETMEDELLTSMESIKEEKRENSEASTSLTFLLLGRAEAATSIIEKQSVQDDQNLEANRIIEGFVLDYDSGLDYTPFQELAQKLRHRIEKINWSEPVERDND